MKLPVFILLISSVSSTNLNTCNEFNSCKETHNEIEWKAKQKIQWKDFIGTMPGNFEYDAGSIIKIRLSYKSKKGNLKYRVCVFFIKDESFYRSPSDTTEYVLNHEQKHFDLGEISARVLRKDLYELSASNETITSDRVTQLYNKCIAYCNTIQNEYDTETFRSINFEKQDIWNTKVVKMLDSLSQYK